MAPKEGKNAKSKRPHHAKEILGKDQPVPEKNNVDGSKFSDVLRWLSHFRQSTSIQAETRLSESSLGSSLWYR